MYRAILLFFLICSLPIFTLAQGSSPELTIAAAADLQFAFQQLGAEFQNQTGIPVRVTYGSSGNFATQIENGAPFDLYFSADVQYPEKLISGGFAEPKSLYRYANGKLVLWVPNGSAIDIGKGLSALTNPTVHKIAIANPRHAPYGRAAVAALKSAGVYDKVENKLVIGENISQTAQFVQSGTADVGLIALSLALSPGMSHAGHYVEVPAAFYPAIQQAAAIVSRSGQKSEAEKFLQFMKSKQARQVMEKYGFIVPAQ